MPYSYPDSVPKVAKNWNATRQKKCTKTANAVLQAGGTEQEAIFACIHAAKIKQMDEDAYDAATEEQAEAFQKLVAAYFAGILTLAALRRIFKDNLQKFYVQLAQLGSGADRHLTTYDAAFLDKQLQQANTYLDGFMEDLVAGRISEARALWRAGRYAYPRAVFVNFTVAADVAALMPVLPGDDCLGNGLCKCHLQVENAGDGVAVYWVLDPAAESCAVCIAHAIESPFLFSREELANAF